MDGCFCPPGRCPALGGGPHPDARPCPHPGATALLPSPRHRAGRRDQHRLPAPAPLPLHPRRPHLCPGGLLHLPLQLLVGTPPHPVPPEARCGGGPAGPHPSPAPCSCPPAPAPGGCGSAGTSRARAPAPSRAAPTSPPTTRGSTTCTGTAATSCPRWGRPGPQPPAQEGSVVAVGAGLKPPQSPPGPHPRGKPPGSPSQGTEGLPDPEISSWGRLQVQRPREPVACGGAPGAGPPPTPTHAHSAPPRLALEMCGQRLHRAGRAAEVRPDGQRELPQNRDPELERRGHGEGPAPTPGRGVGPGVRGAASNPLSEPHGRSPHSPRPRLPSQTIQIQASGGVFMNSIYTQLPLSAGARPWACRVPCRLSVALGNSRTFQGGLVCRHGVGRQRSAVTTRACV